MDTNSKLEDLNLTPEEIDRFSNAFKDDNFRELLREYAEEILDPENKKRYEEEITLMEKERGMDIKFVHPNPGRVLKTSLDGKQKCFINVCSNELIAKPECKVGNGADGRVGQHWSLPYSVTPGRPDMDSKGKYMIYDVVFHPDTLYIAGKNKRFMKLVDSTAIQGVQNQFSVKLDETNVKVLNMKYKGVPNPSVIRKPIPGQPAKQTDADDPLRFPYPYDCTQGESRKPTKPTKPASDPDLPKKPTIPRHTVKYRSYIDLQDYRCSRDSAPGPRPREMLITIDLPLLKSAGDADLTVTERRLLLESRQPAYRLELPLSYPVDENKGEAKFNKLKGQLTVTLAVLPLKTPLMNVVDLSVQPASSKESQNTCSVDGDNGSTKYEHVGGGHETPPPGEEVSVGNQSQPLPRSEQDTAISDTLALVDEGKDGEVNFQFSIDGGEVEKEQERVEDDLPTRQGHQSSDDKPPSVILREIDPRDGRVEDVTDHTTSAAFRLQNTLLYELD
uniref:Protein kintoun n=1 Tax=Paramormyrops kingsleyae TaxID=1676925 RepID=A0A3B3QNQ7_9TELE